MLETVPCRQYKPRHRKSLSVTELQAIVDAYTKDYMSQEDVARKFRVTTTLVSNLVAESKKKPEKMKEAKYRVKLDSERRKAIQQIVEDLLNEVKPITSSAMVQRAVKDKAGLEVSRKLVQ